MSNTLEQEKARVEQIAWVDRPYRQQLAETFRLLFGDDMHRRSSRSKEAKEIGQQMYRYIEKQLAVFQGDAWVRRFTENYTDAQSRSESMQERADEIIKHMSLFWDIRPKEDAFKTKDEYVVQVEYDPDKKGFIADMEVKDTCLDDYMRGVLQVGGLGFVPSDTKAFEHTPFEIPKGNRIVAYRTVLTDTDGIVLLEHIDNVDKRVENARLVMYPMLRLLPNTNDMPQIKQK